jgi:hypothetical protein
MFLILAVFGSLLGLFVIGSAVFTAWHIFNHNKGVRERTAHKLLHRWSLFDCAVLVLFCIGLMFLLIDLLAVIRDRDSYPLYHLGYLLSGVSFSFLGMLFMLVRLLATLRLSQANRSPLADHHHKPDHTDKPEQWVQG